MGKGETFEPTALDSRWIWIARVVAPTPPRGRLARERRRRGHPLVRKFWAIMLRLYRFNPRRRGIHGYHI